MKHKYIDETTIYKFDKNIKAENIAYELTDKFKIQNIDDKNEQSLIKISLALQSDIQHKRCNYKAYIEEGMNARMLMTLRTIAVLPLSDSFTQAFRDCNTCETPKDVKEIRLKYLKRVAKDYEDLDWQYFYIVKTFLGKDGAGFEFDFESCYADGVIKDQTFEDQYLDSVVWNCMAESRRELKYKDRDPWKSYIKT